MAKEKWIQGAIQKKGALRRSLGKKKNEKISVSEVNSKIAQLRKKAKGKKKLTPNERKLLRRLILAKTLMRLRKKK